MYTTQKQKGFTLIELLVVIAIIGLLSSVVLSSVAEAKNRAEIASFKEQVRAINEAYVAFRTETGSYPYNLNNSSRWDSDGEAALQEDLQEVIDAGFLTGVPDPSGVIVGPIDYLYYDPWKNGGGTLARQCEDVPGNQMPYMINFISQEDLTGEFPRLIHTQSGQQIANGNGAYWCTHLPI